MSLLKNSNTLFIVILCYLLTCVTGVVNIIPMLIKVQAAQSFHVATYQIGYVFSFYMFGMLFGSLLNGHILKFITVKQNIFTASGLYVISVAALYLVHSLFATTIVVIVMGFVGGMTLTLPYMIVVHAFQGKNRSSTLNRVDLMYSVGAFIIPPVAGILLTAHYSWQSVFAIVLVFFAVICLLAYKSILPNVNIPLNASEHHEPFSKWNLNIYLISLAMFAYVASYMGLNYWLIHYATDVLHLKMSTALFGESAFWWFYAVGCLISSFAVKVFELHKYMITSALLALIAYLMLLDAHNAGFFIFTISLLGLACSTLYSSSLSYGTHQVKNPSPRIISFFVATATTGTLLSELISSYMVHHYGLRSVVGLSAALMLAYLVLFSITLCRNGTKHHFVINNAD